MTSPGSGGYRPPLHPAPVSGPGALSARTDGASPPVPSGMPYGERQATEARIQAAPIRPQSGGPQPPSPSEMAAPPQLPPALDAPSMHPDQPITAGAAFGDGPGPEVLAAQPAVQPGSISAVLSKLAAVDTSGDVANLMVKAMRGGV